MQNGDLSNLRRATAGFAAGITEALVVVTPFEVVKIKLQQQKGTSKELLRYRVRPSSINAHYYRGCCSSDPSAGYFLFSGGRRPSSTEATAKSNCTTVGDDTTIL